MSGEDGPGTIVVVVDGDVEVIVGNLSDKRCDLVLVDALARLNRTYADDSGKGPA